MPDHEQYLPYHLRELIDRLRERYSHNGSMGYDVGVIELTVETERQITSLMLALDRERQTFPSPGVFISEQTRGGASYRKIAKLGELPDPVGFAAFVRHESLIARVIAESRREAAMVVNDYGVTLHLSPASMAERIVRAVYEAERQVG